MDRILRSHGEITPRTDGSQIGDLQAAAVRFGNIMTDMEVKHGHHVSTPGNDAPALEFATGVRDPHLFAEGLGYIRLGFLGRRHLIGLGHTGFRSGRM